MRLIALVLFFGAAAFGQVLPGPQFFRIKEFLSMSDEQYLAIFRNNDEYLRSLQDKQRRMAQLSQEIAIELGRDVPDPMEIGSRQVEIEQICRIVRSEGTDQLITKNRAVLTEQQRTRLRSFEDALKVMPAYTEALGFRLMDDLPVTIPGSPTPVTVRAVILPVPPPGFNPGGGLPGCIVRTAPIPPFLQAAPESKNN